MLNQDFSDILSALSDARAEFLLVGAYAMAYHGVPRATGDLDVWVNPSPDNAGRVMEALKRFGAPMDKFTREELTKPDWVFQLGVAPRRIDIITSVSGVSFADAWKKRVAGKLGGQRIPVLDRASLIKNKRSAGRPKDLADAAALEELPHDKRG